MPINTGPKQKVFVPVYGMKYGFMMDRNSFGAFGGQLGIKDAAAEGGVFYGANSPKPPRAVKKENGVSQSGFYDLAKAKSLANAGWKLSGAGILRSIKTTGAAITVCVDTPFGKSYAWNIPANRRQIAIELGATVPTDPTQLVWGAYPKPPRATKIDNGVRTSTFCPPDQVSIDAAASKGYSVEGLDGDWFNI
ncbi:hypothetical protein VKI21_06990 [Cyanobacterium aponinum UTEX 3222]|uniref:hypothetical protein n=1 Tax=Cyanobacterium aponinum TaxID=379064 RepID=UPI0030851910|nr:hypothetical protein VKI21_06990 [Cyanobacterium aponinum UTEX 3222]